MSAEKKAQVLQLEPPQELIFKGPFNDVITANLNLRNPSEKTVLFKVKTTAPKQYCVRPNSGVLEPTKDQTIAVMLQPSMDLSTVDKSKHKFMVQSMYAPSDFTSENLDQLWKTVPKTELMDSKLKCSFVEDHTLHLLTTEATQTSAPHEDGQGVEEVAAADKEDLLMVSVTLTGESTLQQAAQSTSIKEEETSVAKPTGTTATIQSTAGSTPAHIIKSDKEQAETDAKLRALQDRIDLISSENTQLKGESNQLRQRIKQSTGATVTATAKFPPSGSSPTPSSPLNIIAVLLILVALILGYLVGRWL